MSGWKFSDITTAASAPDLLSVGWPPVVYSLNPKGSQHVYYLYYLSGQFVRDRDTGAVVDIADASVNELRRGSRGWHHNDLTAAMELPLMVPAAGYAFNVQGTRHVICAAADLHIHELSADAKGWHHSDLTVVTGAPIGIPMSGYAFEAQGTRHVIYLDDAPSAHIRELWWDTNGWHHNDLTAATGAPIGNAVGYAFEAQYTQHIFYSGSTDHHVHELWWDTSGWHHHDLTAATGAPAPAGRLPAYPHPMTWDFVHAYPFDAQATQHVVFLVGDHIHELWWDTKGWHHDDLTVAANAPGAAENATPVAYPANAQGSRHVVYRGTGNDDHIHELRWDATGWHHHDLTIATGASSIWPEAGVVSDSSGVQRIICLGPSGDDAAGWEQLLIYELSGQTGPNPLWKPKPPKAVVPPFLKKPPPPFRTTPPLLFPNNPLRPVR